MPDLPAPPHLKAKRDRRIMIDGVRKDLRVCASCHDENYIVEGQTVCEECKSKRRKRRK
jgi:hypothetical protein